MNQAQAFDTPWTPQKLEQAWRIFDKAIPVMADGMGVPATQLRAYLLEGVEPPLSAEVLPPTLGARLIACHADHPEWSAKQCALYLGASYDTIRGLASRHGIVFRIGALDAALKGARSNDLFHLIDGTGDFLHESCLRMTDERTRAWKGTPKQLEAVRGKYRISKGLTASRILS